MTIYTVHACHKSSYQQLLHFLYKIYRHKGVHRFVGVLVGGREGEGRRSYAYTLHAVYPSSPKPQVMLQPVAYAMNKIKRLGRVYRFILVRAKIIEYSLVKIFETQATLINLSFRRTIRLSRSLQTYSNKFIYIVFKEECCCMKIPLFLQEFIFINCVLKIVRCQSSE